MKTVRCPICKVQVRTRTKHFPFCSSRCKLIDAGNWLEGAYWVPTDDGEPPWGHE
ncbi:MAG: DNA gyrase inhibitor YacG [Myxococcota bacterium]